MYVPCGRCFRPDKDGFLCPIVPCGRFLHAGYESVITVAKLAHCFLHAGRHFTDINTQITFLCPASGTCVRNAGLLPCTVCYFMLLRYSDGDIPICRCTYRLKYDNDEKLKRDAMSPMGTSFVQSMRVMWFTVKRSIQYEAGRPQALRHISDR